MPKKPQRIIAPTAGQPEPSAADQRHASSEPTTPEERAEYGRSLRERTPRESHAEWSPGPERADPVKLIEEQNEDRISWLIPVRRTRMSVSAFTFYRGAARIMAWDLVRSPVSGLQVQLCGDAHLSNFGLYASPERRLVFDLNDFDETLPGPWEWDLKRLAASFFIAGRFNGLSKKASRRLARGVVRSYRKSMARMAEMRTLDVWYSLIEADRTLEVVEDKKTKRKGKKTIDKAMSKDHLHVLDRLAEEVDGEYRIRHDPPLIVRVRDVRKESDRDAIRDRLETSFAEYLRSVPDHVEHVLRQYRPVDFAVKVVGVGSVGTRCFITLLQGRDRSDPLFLQTKEAGPSVLEEVLPASRYPTGGQRVVEGQRLMQTVSDVFLGHVASETGRDFYMRQLKDWKGSADVENASERGLVHTARLRGWTLARAHARTGDPIAIAAYLGDDQTFDRAVGEFSGRYAKQNARDYEAFREEIRTGRLEAREYE